MGGIDGQHVGQAARELPRHSTLKRLTRPAYTVLRALAALVLLSFAASTLLRLSLVTLEASRGGELMLIRLIVAVASTISVMVGYAVLAGLPLRGVGRAVQVGVLLLSVILTVALGPRATVVRDWPVTSQDVTYLLVALVMVGVSWVIIRKPQLHVAYTAIQAVGLVIVGTILAFLL